MGCCFGSNPKESARELLKLADRAFAKIDLHNHKKISHQDLEHACKILLAEIDLNQDGLITKNEWIGYWEYLRRAGYKPFMIKKELQRILKGQIPEKTFGKAREYRQSQPRELVIDGIIEELKNQNDLPIMLQR